MNFSKIKTKFISLGKTVKVKRFKDGHRPEITEFNFAIIDFGFLFEKVKNKSVSVGKRIKKSASSFRILSAENPQKINPLLQKITKLANLPGNPSDVAKHRLTYQKALSRICQPMVDEIKDEGINETLGMIIERGSLLIGAFYDFPKDQIGRITAKRLDKNDGTLGLGLSNLSLPSKLNRFKKLHIQEDCLATGDTVGGIVLALKEKGIFFEDVQIDCPVVSQFGAEFLLKFLPFLGVKKVVIKAGGLCYKLDEHYYLRRTKEAGYKNCDYYVGDMGEWSKKLPELYDKVALWNSKRLDY